MVSNTHQQRRPRLLILLWPMLAMVILAAPAVAAGAESPAGGRTGEQQQFVPGQVLVRFDSGVDGAERAAVRSEAGVDLEQRLRPPGLELVDLPGGASVDESVSSLERRPEVKYAEPNYVYRTSATVPNDQYFPAQYGFDNTGQAPWGGTPDADVDAPEAWDGTTGSSSVNVAVADSGVVFSHPDLAANLRATGYDFIGNDGDPTDPLAPGPAQGHGTKVAGVVGAEGGNGIDVAGVNWHVGIVPIRACDDTQCTLAAITSAMYYARDNGVPVFNGSFGGPLFSQTMKDAIDASPNVLFVFSAGNDSLDTDTVPQYPCAFDSANIICVAATDQFDQLWSGSNYGGSTVDLAAPGLQVLTTFAFYDLNPLTAATGTSFAAPFVSGAAALVLSTSPGASPAQLKATILGGVDPLASLSGKVATGGRLNLDHIVPDGPPVKDTTPPSTGILRGPAHRTFSRRATFAFASSEPGSTFVCNLDRSRFSSCTSPKYFRHQKPGNHTFQVVATDLAGNADPTPARYLWRIKRHRHRR